MEIVTLKYILKNLKIPFFENTRQIYLDCPQCQGKQTFYATKEVKVNADGTREESFHCFQCNTSGNGFKKLLTLCSSEYKDLCAFEEFSKAKGLNEKKTSVEKKCHCDSRDLFNYGCRCGGT